MLRCFLLLLAALCCGVTSMNIPMNAQMRSNAVRGLDPTKPISEYRHSIWTVNNGLPQNSALTLCQTRDGYLWIGTQEGIARFDGLKFRVFGKHRCWSCAVDLRVDGALTPSPTFPHPFPHPTLSQWGRASGTTTLALWQSVRSASESIITLPATAENLEFQYTATCLTAAERVKFKYILEGYDKDWVEAGNRRTAYYNNLPRGRSYRFRVIACNNDGVWNETGAWAEFRITPYWWETWWFYGLCVMVVVGTSYQGFCWRTRRLRAKAQELERLVSVRTKEVQEQAREIQLANTELSEKNLELSIALHQLQTTQAQLVHTEKMAGLGQVTAGVAHEINNPVSFIAAALPMLKEDLESVFDVLRAAITLSPQSTGEEFSRWEALKRERDLDALLPEIYEFLDSMKIGAERIAEIVRSLRTFSRLDEDVLKLANLHDGLDSTLVILRNQYRERIRIEKHYQADLPAVQCYPGQINQVFINVLANAVQAIKGQGVITITTHVVDALVEIRISDTGAGMSAEVQARAFEPFYTTKDVGKGTGLGLSISFGIVEQHHGTIRLDSVLGEGTTVEIRLPLNQPKRRC